ncbi:MULTISPECIES: molecular chaperone [Sphingobium]|jgi:fimbrial chaperone protein|uniref:Molecular chaperone n=1 Tax=Sphingobium fuliginis (strain ATCC 27551) TaxID=336203 RepID=A0A292ZD14_SPHSA|nr:MULTISPECIES: fimbria/pilus periplasmic chaperone [Sphingobium]QOT70268.1 molecular chaperone [Sphingobium fuliginis]GAY20734.1 sigma-fimbriae chaperone protein [Sphingobium fuliginis]
MNRGYASVAAAAAMLSAPPVQAAGLKVFPVRVVLTPAEPVQTMAIENSSKESARVQLRVYGWRQEKGEDVLEETRDVLANPALFEVRPGAVQIARFGLRTGTGAAEKSYRVILEEVPGTRAVPAGTVQTLLRISIPIFVPPARGSGRLVWRAWPSGPRQMTFAIRNEGNAHVQINRLILSRKGGPQVARQDMSVYLLPGSSQQVVLDTAASIASGQTLKLDAMTDQADVAAEIVAEERPREVARP